MNDLVLLAKARAAELRAGANAADDRGAVVAEAEADKWDRIAVMISEPAAPGCSHSQTTC